MIKATCALIFLDKSKRIILGVSRKGNPNDFGLPGGKVDEGETFVEALKREVMEETGISIIVDESDYFEKAEGDKYLVRTYICTIDETKEIAFVDPKETGIVKGIPFSEVFKGSFRDYNLALKDYFNL